jgi:hypothetical protein
MYLKHGEEFFRVRPEKPEEAEVYDYIRQLASKPSSEAIEAFYQLFFQGNAYPQKDVSIALARIVKTTDADSYFKYVINRCFYIIGNVWRLDKNRHEALRRLITRAENLPTKVANDPVVRRLHHHLHAYLKSDLYLVLRRQMRLLEEEDTTPCEENRLFGENLRRFFFVQEAVVTTKDIPLSYRNSIRQQQAQIARKTRQRIDSYLASRRQNAQVEPLPNPTLIPDTHVLQAIEAYQPEQPNSCLNEARRFEQYYRSLRTIGELKQEIREYVLAPLIEADSRYANNRFTRRFQNMLNCIDFKDHIPNNDVSTTILCQRILQHLIVKDIHHRDTTEFQEMICLVGYQVVTTVLLRIVMFWKRIRSWLEDRFGILFHIYESYHKHDVEWYVQAFEHMNLALVLNAESMGYVRQNLIS